MRGEALNRAHRKLLAHIGKADSDAVLAGATGTTDAVNVIFSLTRQIIVDHVRDALDVDAARGHIGSNQYTQAAFTQHLQGAGTRALLHVAMQCGG